MQQAVDELVTQIEAVYPDLPNARWVAIRLLDGDESIINAVRSGELGELSQGVPEQAESGMSIPLEPA